MGENTVKELIFKCGVCQQGFEDIFLYFKHFSEHKQVTFQECFHLCETSNKWKHSLDYCMHCLELTDTEPFTCQVCLKSFKTMCMLHRHIVDNHPKIISYDIDIEARTARADLEDGSGDLAEEISETATDEVKQEIGVVPFVCYFCNSGHTRVVDFLKHLQTHGRFKFNKCFHLCDIEELDEQIKETNKIDKFLCRTCGTWYQSMCLVFKHFSCKKSCKSYTVSLHNKTVYVGSQQCLDVKSKFVGNKLSPKERLKETRKEFQEKRMCFVLLEDCAGLITKSGIEKVPSTSPIPLSEQEAREHSSHDRLSSVLEDGFSKSVTDDKGFEGTKQQFESDSKRLIVNFSSEMSTDDGNEEGSKNGSSGKGEQIESECHENTSKLQRQATLGRPRKNFFKSSFVRKMQYYERKKKLLSQPTICQLCGIKLKKMCIKRHMKLVHSDTGPATCEKCGKVFSCKYYCERHISYIHSNKVYVCDECGKTFKVKVYLKNHKESHNKERIYKCEECEKTFYTKASLRAHRLRKKKVRDQQCPHCEKMFDKRGLRNHIRDVHADSSKWICTFSGCEKRFKSRRFLRRHIVRHQEIKPEVCDFCGVSFAQRGELKSHVRRIHGVQELTKKKIEDADRDERQKRLVSIDVDPEMFGEEGLKTIRM
ncbi:zinc finger protein 652-like isoform X1 [Mercenaria mercenaria]|uniref:zinc finger protein 652-like isoform X1 n=1 Tax=Mercenaria mercenaria TaxID=6596 RepID=UPI00234EA65B|nr:zinc finger protein 652-like isoform X1 [Mercenaria mercenaria]